MINISTPASVELGWQQLVNDAARSCNQKLDEDLESYLVFALIRFTRQTNIAGSVFALEYLESVDKSGQVKYEHLRDLGDKCLLCSGLFPQSSQNKMVNLDYYINIGISSYSQISTLFHKGFAKLYDRLASCFVLLTDILHSMQELDGIPVMSQKEKYSFWLNFNSQYAKQSLKEYYGVEPLRPMK
ncbi:hypothetical protein MNBD_GAMMA12-478 [hydrothermal vent metagenome]|uniref:Uncharacterized protein n=1 Tax=hydrothermal vent metagenome TaxID=652676 RepID=A0A3B0YEK9_9ZZZZ